MSLWRDDVRASPAAVAVVVALGIVAAVGLERTFTSMRYLAWALPAMAVGAVFAAAFGRRSLGAAFAGLVVAEFLTLPALFARDETVYLFPTSGALATVWQLLGSGLSGVLREAAPVLPEPRYLAVIWTVSTALGFLGAAWIIVGRPIGAVATALGVVAFAGQVGAGGGRVLYGVAAVALALLFLLADGRHRILSWGRRGVGIPAGWGVPTVAVAVVVAVVTPGIVGAANPLISFEGTLSPRLVIIKPLSDVQRQLQVDPPIEVMRVSAAQATYWRLTGLPTYTGEEWLLEARPQPVEESPLPLPEPPPSGELLVQSYRITSLLAPWLPAAFAATDVQAPVPYEIDEPSSTLLIQGDSLPGLSYTVTSRLAQPVIPGGGLPGEGRPQDGTEVWGELAREIVGDAATPLEQAIELERHFRTYAYDEQVSGGHSEGRLRAFLEQRRGYCEQFAATMTLMLRGLGVESRVGVGFLPGRSTGGAFVVSTRDAHAWVEANVPGLGWVTFDPTPGRGQPASEAATEPEVAEPSPAPQAAPEPEQPEPTPVPEQQPGAEDVPSGVEVPAWAWGALLAIAVVGSVPGAKRVRRRLRRSRPGAEAAVAAWAELMDRAADLGLGAVAAETQWELYHRFFLGASQPARDAARAVAWSTLVALYGPSSSDVPDPTEVWGRLDSALRGLRRTVPWWRRMLSVVDPRTLIPAHLAATAREVLRRTLRRPRLAGGLR